MESRYEALMDVVRGRMTNRAFAPAEIPRAHVEMILTQSFHRYFLARITHVSSAVPYPPPMRGINLP